MLHAFVETSRLIKARQNFFNEKIPLFPQQDGNFGSHLHAQEAQRFASNMLLHPLGKLRKSRRLHRQRKTTVNHQKK